MNIARKIAAVIAAGLCVLFVITAFTVPAFAATPYLIVGIVLGVLTWLIWPKRNRNAT